MKRSIFAVAGVLLFAPLPAAAQDHPAGLEGAVAQAQKEPSKAADKDKNTMAPAKENDSSAPMKKKKPKAGGCG